MLKNILVTGGLGYIGSNIVLNLLKNDFNAFVIDNLSNSYALKKDLIASCAKKDFNCSFFDINNVELLKDFLIKNQIDAVIHCAGLKSVTESVTEPEKYYTSIVETTKNLLIGCKQANIKNIMLSSSAVVYGDTKEFPILERFETNPKSPYAKYKLVAENLFKEYATENNAKAIVFRYFNVLGAGENGLLGDKPTKNYVNLIKNITDAFYSESKVFKIAGQDRPTPDGTGMRDYIHVTDLATAHIKALENIEKLENFEIFNLCSAKPYSVLEIFNIYNKLSGNSMTYEIISRRPGDADISYGNNEKAKTILNWKITKNLKQMISSHYKFILLNNSKK